MACQVQDKTQTDYSNKIVCMFGSRVERRKLRPAGPAITPIARSGTHESSEVIPKLTGTPAGEDNFPMSRPSSTSTATYSLSLLSSEAASLLEQARKYREIMDGLDLTDPRREVYDQVIRDLLERSRRLSSVVVTTTASSS